jgi:hypothetical protein
MMKTEREKVVELASSFAPLLSDPNLTEMDIDAMIEELRPLRMKICAIDYGSAPGFRKYDADHNEKKSAAKPKINEVWL